MNYLRTSDSQITALGHQREHLDNARMAEFVFSPKSDQARALAAQLTELTVEHEARVQPRTRKRQAKPFKDFQGAVAAFAADLIHHSQFEEAGGFMYRSSDRDQLQDTLVSSRSFEQLVRFWPEMGWMEKTSFVRAKETWEGDVTHVFMAKAARYRATPALLRMAEQYGINGLNIRDHFTKEVSRITPVTVRSEEISKGGRKSGPRSVRIKDQRFDEEVRRVTDINAILADGGFDLKDTPLVYRLFNRGKYRDFDFDLGGKLYCRSEDNWQQMPKAQRSGITWRGEPTVELDVRSSHLFILYALNGVGLDASSDPYHLPGIERDVVKGVFTATTGKGSYPRRWPQGLSKAYQEKTGLSVAKTYELSEVVQALRDKHPVLDTIRQGELDWAKLQYEESECFMACLSCLGREHGVAALPVFDSLIVAERHQELARTVLGEAYKQRLGFSPVIRVG